MTYECRVPKLEMVKCFDRYVTRRTEEEQFCDEQAWSRMDDEGCPNVEPTGFEKDLTRMENTSALNHPIRIPDAVRRRAEELSKS